MSSQINPVLVKDDILMVSDVIDYAVMKGGQNVSVQQFPATSTSSNSHVYQINVPSTSVVLDRHLLWHADITFTVTGTPVTGRPLVDWGLTASPAPFILHQLCQNMSAQINNTSISATTNQILDPILRCLDKKTLARYNSTTAVYLDNYGNYDTLDNLSGALNNPMGGYDRAADPEYLPRGCLRLQVVSGNAINGTSAVIKVSVTEPIMLSPFLYGETEHKSAGFHGITNINFNMAMDPLAKRALRFTTAGPSVTAVSYDKCYIECRFLTPHPSDLLPETNIVPYQEFTNYIKTDANLAIGASNTVITSNNIQLSSIPDKVLVWVRPKQSAQTWSTPDAYATVTNVSVLFNNQSGLLSSASPQQLFNFSQEAGLKQTWAEWSGLATVNVGGATAPIDYATCAGPLVLNFAEHIGIPEDYYSCSSIGSFNFQITATVTNNLGFAFDAELNVMFLQSGIFSTSNGVSSKYLGILSKQQVLDASLQAPVGKADLARIVGGGFFSRLWDGAKSVAGVVKKGLDVVGTPVRKVAEMIPHPITQGVATGLKAVGYGLSGGARSGGRMAKHVM
jgi:hypothetical protein